MTLAATETFRSPARGADWQTLTRVVLSVVGFALLLFVAMPWGRELIVQAGHHIPQPDMESDYLLGLGWAIALGLSIWLWPVSRDERRTLMWIWLAKVEMMLGFMLFYEWNYGLDAYNYWEQGRPGIMPPVAVVFGDGNAFIARASQWQWEFLVGNSYHAEKVSFGYVGLIGTLIYYRAARAFLGRDDVRVLWLIGLVPSALQWSSILGKDPIVYCGIALYSFGVVRLYRRPSFLSTLGIVAGIALASTIRPWMAAILTAPLAVFGVISIRRPITRVLVSVVASAGFFVALSIFSDVLKISSVDDVVQQSQDLSQSFDAGGSARSSEIEHQNSLEKMIYFAPLGVLSALFRPLPGEVPNVFGFLASGENVLLIVLLLYAFRRSRLGDLADPVLLWAITLVLVWSLVYGFICYHNAGTGIRYRFQIFPILFGAVAYLARRRA